MHFLYFSPLLAKLDCDKYDQISSDEYSFAYLFISFTFSLFANLDCLRLHVHVYVHLHA